MILALIRNSGIIMRKCRLYIHVKQITEIQCTQLRSHYIRVKSTTNRKGYLFDHMRPFHTQIIKINIFKHILYSTLYLKVYMSLWCLKQKYNIGSHCFIA